MVHLTRLPAPRIVYEDNHILAAIKPPGYLAQADGSAAHDMLTWLKTDIKERCHKPGNVYLGLLHRLDQPAGGVMLFARTSKAAARLSSQIRMHQWHKYYLTVVSGCPEPVCGCLRDNLVKDSKRNRVTVTDATHGQQAWLQYRVLARDTSDDLSLLAVSLGTGRPHQIRVQLSSRGWPIAGDQRYGSRERSCRGPVDLALWCAALDIEHPVRHERMLLAALPPPVWPWTCFELPSAGDLPALFIDC